ncbi:MAG: hypothetical protein ACRDF4_10530, partial [Rhabdochlamydiaceae bacterium]
HRPVSSVYLSIIHETGWRVEMSGFELSFEKSQQIKEKIAALFVAEFGCRVSLDDVVLTRVVIDYYRLGEKGPCGTLSLFVKPIDDKGFKMVPFKYVEHLIELLKTSEARKLKGFSKFVCTGISANYDTNLVFRIEFENLQHPELPNYRRSFDQKRKEAERVVREQNGKPVITFDV